MHCLVQSSSCPLGTEETELSSEGGTPRQTQPGIIGYHGRCLQRKVEQNGHHGFGGQLRKFGGCSGASRSP
jgi:hypothetical protein